MPTCPALRLAGQADQKIVEGTNATIETGAAMAAVQELDADSHLVGQEGAQGIIRLGGIFTCGDKGLEGLLRQDQRVVIPNDLASSLIGMLQDEGGYRGTQQGSGPFDQGLHFGTGAQIDAGTFGGQGDCR